VHSLAPPPAHATHACAPTPAIPEGRRQPPPSAPAPIAWLSCMHARRPSPSPHAPLQAYLRLAWLRRACARSLSGCGSPCRVHEERCACMGGDLHSACVYCEPACVLGCILDRYLYSRGQAPLHACAGHQLLRHACMGHHFPLSAGRHSGLRSRMHTGARCPGRANPLHAHGACAGWG
jgi:hypothetical protein